MIDFQNSLEMLKYFVLYPLLVITSLSACYTFLIRTYSNFQKNKSKSLDVRICKCGGLYYGANRKNGINRMEINGNIYVSVDDSHDVVDLQGKTIKSSTEPKTVNLNNNNQKSIRSRNKIADDSIVLKNVHNRHVVSTMKEKFELHNSANGEQSQMNVRTLSPARTINFNRTPVKTNLLKYFNGEGSNTNFSKVQELKTVRTVNQMKRKSPEKSFEAVKRLSQCSISELLDQLNDQGDLQELCTEFVDTDPIEPQAVQLRQKSVSVESLLGSKRLSLYSGSPLSRKTSRPLSTENLLSLHRSLSQKSLSNSNLNDIITQEIYDAILQSKNFDTALSFDDLLHVEELSRCLSEYSITELLKDSNFEEE